MKTSISIFFILVTATIYSQQSDNYKRLISNLKPIDSLQVIKQNKDKIKGQGLSVYYQCQDKYYSFYKGEYIQYYNNGNISQINIYDKIGTLLYAKKNNRKGYIQSELIATKISSKTNKLCDLLDEYDNLIIHLTANYYKYSKALDSVYIYKTVYLKEGKKIKTEKFDEPKV